MLVRFAVLERRRKRMPEWWNFSLSSWRGMVRAGRAERWQAAGAERGERWPGRGGDGQGRPWAWAWAR